MTILIQYQRPLIIGQNIHRMRFAFIGQFLADYARALTAVPETLHDPLAFLAKRTALVDFAEARDAQRYVRRIATVCDLAPSSEQIDAAVGNISPALFRIDRDDLPEEEIGWARRTGAQNAYREIFRLLGS